MDQQFEKQIILVDMRDEVTGTAEMLEAHEKGLLHRAFSAFIFCGGRLLMQKSEDCNREKIWINACRSHPYAGERTSNDVRNRILEETGMNLEPEEAGSFIYRTEYDTEMTEYEYIHVYIAECEELRCMNLVESEDMCWRDISEIEEELKTNPHEFAEWFPTAFIMALQHRPVPKDPKGLNIAVSDYLQYLRELNLNELFDARTAASFDNIQKKYGMMPAQAAIMEVNLGKMERSGDFSFHIPFDSDGYMKNGWIEIDASEYGTPEINPCRFVDASTVKPGEDNEIYFQTVLTELIGKECTMLLKPQLERMLTALEGKVKRIYQFGSMTSRGETDSLRVYVGGIRAGNIREFLMQMQWDGSMELLSSTLNDFEGMVPYRLFGMGFDIQKDGIGRKIGIEIYPKSVDVKYAENILESLDEKGLCIYPKKQEVLNFLKSGVNQTPRIQGTVSHFKVTVEGDTIQSAKAYLKMNSRLTSDSQMFRMPLMMNMELVSQSRQQNREISLNVARYWLDEAAQNGVRYVYLNDRENTRYPYLPELVAECRRLGIKSRVILSGEWEEEAELQRIIEAGADKIHVPFHGKNQIHILELLREIGFENIAIDWIMDCSNAEEFSDAVHIAEKYGVKELFIRRIRPDFELFSSAPTKEQMEKCVKQIRAYTGNLKIRIDNCFSQLRALLGRRAVPLFNDNVGIFRGCLAGRASFSVNTDGFLTPCPYLDFPEQTLSLKNYWENSPVLEQLRTVESNMKTPCRTCYMNTYCLPCSAVCYNLNGEIEMGGSTCMLRSVE